MTGMHELFPDGKPVDKELLRQGLAGPVLNLQGFGAFPDGRTDISTAFRNALASANDGAIILLPPGPYILRRPVVISKNGIRVVMQGATIQVAELREPGLEGVHHRFPATPAFHVTGRNVDLDGGHVIAGPIDAPVSAGILLDGARHCRIRDMRISGAFYASIWPGGGSEDVLIDSCVIEGAVENIVLGFISQKGPQLTRIVVRDVTSTGSNDNGLLAHGHVHDLQIIGGMYRQNRKDGIDLFTSAEDVTIQGVHCIENGVKGLDFKYTSEWTGKPGEGVGLVGRVTVSGCHLTDNGHAGCSVSISSTEDYPDIGISHFLIQGNQAHRNGDHGFYFVLREGIVANNISHNNGNRGFNFLSCRDVVVSGNEAIDNCLKQTGSTEGFGFNLESNGASPPPNRRLSIVGNIARRNSSAGNQNEGFALHATRIESSTFIGNVSSGHSRNVATSGSLRNVEMVGNVEG